MEAINQEFLQQYFNKFRKGYYACESGGYKEGYTNRFGMPSIRANTWEGLLENFLDVQDPKETQWVEAQGFNPVYPYATLETEPIAVK